MNALTRYWQNFARYVKRGHAKPLLVIEPVPVETWAERKAAFDRAQRTHHGRGETAARLRQATYERLRTGLLEKEAPELLAVLETHHWLCSDPVIVEGAIKAAARVRAGARQ